MTEEQKFAEYLETDNTFWGGLYRSKNVKTLDEARQVTEEFCRQARVVRFDTNKVIQITPVDYLGITRQSAAH